MSHDQNDVSSELAWKAYLDGFNPCHFPPLLDELPDLRSDFHETVANLDVHDSTVLDFCSRHSLELRCLFQTAWAIVVSCYSGLEDISFAFLANDGSSPNVQHDTAFMFRTYVTAEHFLLDLMIDMTGKYNEISAHRKYSITKIQNLLGLEGQPLFNSVLQVQRSPASQSGQATQSSDLQECDIQARVSIEDDAPIAVRVRAHTSKFSAAQTSDVTHTLGKIISEIVRSHPQSMIKDLEILSRHEHERIMSWNRPVPSSVDDCFHRLFQGVARRAPDAPAICSWDGNFTYGELDVLSTSLANNLAYLGVEPEAFVVICFNKTSIAYAAMLSILKAGGAFVAIDPSYPASRIQAIIEATNASIAVTEPPHCHLFEGSMEHIIAFDCKLADKPSATPNVVESRSSPSNTAYVVFTSGSTGTPKGIMVEHRNLCTATLGLAAPMRIKPSSRVLQFAAYTFDLSYSEIFVTLSQGGCICVPSEHERINDLAGAIVRMNVNTACLIPSVARMFQPEDVPGLQTLLLGGEALVQESLALWGGKVSLTTLYGPSECTIWCSAQINMTADSSASSIGHGVGALLWITNATNHDQLSPIGCIGELLIEGPVVARGYLDAEQTKQSFIENPSWAEIQTGQRRRFYKTGDLVRYKSDGSVSFIGRKDTQVKFRGRRIEIGEIEFHLSSHNLLRQSMVMLPATGVHHGKLVAILVLKTSKESSSGKGEMKMATDVTKQPASAEVMKIKDFMVSRIPSYMVPQHWIIVENIPLMISGKLDRTRAKKFVESLAEEPPAEAKVKQMHKYDLHSTAEIKLRNIWSDVLQKEATDIGVETDFVSLGGDSFAAMELVARCSAQGYTLTVRDLLDNGTIRDVASKLKTPRSEDAETADDAAMVSKVREYSQLPLKFPPVWWDVKPVLLASVKC
ncbi:MAG: hypothetical protein Q9191_000725 [Dirinaria sp. TL-2023a]